ncbi:hypothetical protein KIN20_007356, partial [Parelaphostrongylus tenuis]
MCRPKFLEFHQVPNAAQAFVSRLVMQGVFDVLEQQGRAAGLPDFIIMSILDQLKVNISYTPLECPLVSINPTADVDNGANMMANCVVVSNTVTRICPAMKMCMLNNGAEFISIPSQHMSISGTLTTTNIIMAKLDQGYVAKCGEQSASYFNIRSVWLPLRCGSCHCHLKC